MYPTFTESLATDRSQRLLAEADQRRLAARLPRRHGVVYRAMSMAHRSAPEDPQPPEPVPDLGSVRPRVYVPEQPDRAAADRSDGVPGARG